MIRDRSSFMDLYAVLNVKPNASIKEIRMAYRQAALATHPDKEGGSAQAFHKVAFAFNALTCPSTRREYDRARANFSADDLATPKNKRPNVRAAVSKLDQSRPTPPCRKRSSAHGIGKASQRRCRCDATVPKVPGIHIDVPLDNLQGVLWSMHAERRQKAIAGLPKRVQRALLAHMEIRGKHAKVPKWRRAAAPCKKRAHSTLSQKLRPLKSTHGRTYSAQVDIGLLRFYTFGQRDIEKAVEHQLILSQMRDALCAEAAADHEVWNDVEKVHKIVDGVFRKNGSSQDDVGLRACVQMRATEYVGRKYVITSPAMTLAKVLPVRARLITARTASWESFRDNWVGLMRSTRYARSKKLSRQAAEAVVNKARHEFLERRLRLVVSSTERHLDLNERKKADVSTKKIKRLTKTALSMVGKDGPEDQHMWRERMKLMLQRELSSDEILRFRK